MKTLNELRNEIHANAIAKGFYDNPREVGTSLMLIVSELSEALEADREGNVADMDKFDEWQNNPAYSEETRTNRFKEDFEAYIKNTLEDELADTILRTLDFCGRRNIDIERHIELKMKYNKLREKLHGKKY